MVMFRGNLGWVYKSRGRGSRKAQENDSVNNIKRLLE